MQNHFAPIFALVVALMSVTSSAAPFDPDALIVEEDVIEICADVDCSDPGTCTPDCCGGCPSPCDFVDCSDPSSCTTECCDICPTECDFVDCSDPGLCTPDCCDQCNFACLGVDCSDPGSCTTECCDICPTACDFVDCSDPGLCTPDCCDECNFSCLGVDCSDPGSCTTECCDICPGPCDFIDCSDPSLCTPDCCDECSFPCLGVDCSDPTSCTTECCDICPSLCDFVFCEPVDCFEVDCDPLTGDCTYFPSSGGSCDDGDPCTTNDTCFDGFCGGEPIDCDDSNPCTDDACGPDGVCVYTPNGMPCDDGYVCTVNDSCNDNGECTGEDKVCDDQLECTSDSCEEPDGCVYEPQPSSCEADDNPCTEADCDPDAPGPGTGCVQNPVDGSCDDEDACTSGDFCDGGTCQPGAPVDCDDGMPCTDDSCEPSEGCINEIPSDQCVECEDAVVPPPINVSVSYEVPITTPCPGFFGGEAGLVLSINGSGEKAFSECPKCEASFAAEASLGVQFSACNAAGGGIEGGASYKGTTTYCTECNEDTCKLECGDVKCDSQEFTGFAKVNVTRFFGYQSKVSTGKLGPIPSLSVITKCGVNTKVTVGAKGSYTGDYAGTCDPCPDCNKFGGSGSLGGDASGGCYFRLKMFKGQVTLGCKDCASLGLSFSGGGQIQGGDCGFGGCVEGSVTGKVAAGLPCWDVGVWWFKAAVRCSIGAQGTCKGGNCGNSGCGVDNVYASCSVRRGGCN